MDSFSKKLYLKAKEKYDFSGHRTDAEIIVELMKELGETKADLKIARLELNALNKSATR